MSTEDQLLLDSYKRNKQDERHDNVLVGKAVTLVDSVGKTDGKILKSEIASQRQIEYFQSQIQIQEEKYEKEKERLEELYESKQRNLQRQFEADSERLERALQDKISKAKTETDTKKQWFQGQIDSAESKGKVELISLLKEKKRKESRVLRIADKIQTKKGKKALTNEVINPVEEEEEEDVEVSEREQALAYQESKGFTRIAYCDCDKLYPNYFRECEEEIKERNKQHKESPEVINSKIQAENEAIQASVERQQYEDTLGEINLKRQEALRNAKEAKKGPVEEYEKLKSVYDVLTTEYNHKKLLFERSGKF